MGGCVLFGSTRRIGAVLAIKLLHQNHGGEGGGSFSIRRVARLTAASTLLFPEVRADLMVVLDMPRRLQCSGLDGIQPPHTRPRQDIARRGQALKSQSEAKLDASWIEG
jgi:hypothetical protein